MMLGNRWTGRLGVFAWVMGAIAPWQMAAPAIAQSTRFTDVQSNYWAAACINDLAQRQIIRGYADGRFRPFDPVTRAEFAAMVRQAFPDEAPSREAVQFVDVPANHWAAAAIQDAYRKGFLSGYPGRVFNPNQQIPRVQGLVAIASGLDAVATQPITTVLNSAYADAGMVPEYARAAVAAATEKSWVVNYPQVRQLDPTRLASRAEVASFLCQALNPGVIPAQYIANTQQFSSKTETAALGNVQAELTYQERETLGENFRLVIRRADRTVLDAPVPVNLQRFAGLQVRELDGNSEPEVILDLYSGGAHCCTSSYIYRYDSAQSRYTNVKQAWGNVGYRLEDLDQDGVPEFRSADDRFAARFTAYAASGFPLQIWQYRQGRMNNVTRRYTQLVYNDAFKQWQTYTQARDVGQDGESLRVKGYLAAYLADKYLLGQEQDGWQRVQQAYQFGDRRDYFVDLRNFLRETGYAQD